MLLALSLGMRAFSKTPVSGSSQVLVEDSFAVKFYYQRAVGVFDITYLNNADQINSLQQFLLQYPEAQIKSIHVAASASPDGYMRFNYQFSAERAKSMFDYLCVRFPNYFNKSVPLTMDYLGEDWSGVVAALQSSNIADRDYAIHIIRTIPDPDTRKQLLRKIRKGALWNTMFEEIFPYLRAAEVKIYLQVPKEETKTLISIDSLDVRSMKATDEFWKEEESTVTNSRSASHTDIAFKTNVLMDAATALNLEMECSLGTHCSISLPVYYNPFILYKKFTLKTFSIQPEFRYWFNEALNGHFLGAHAIFGYYNFYSTGKYRYQDRNGKNPAIGGGISYGYSASLAKHWALEFSVGVGYVYLDYDRFYNVKNGKLIDSKRTHFIGPTKASVTLVYKLFGKETDK